MKQLYRICPNRQRNPKCKHTISYKCEISFSRANELKRECRSCSAYSNKIDEIYNRKCPNPNNNPNYPDILYYKSKYDRNNAEIAKLNCRGCNLYGKPRIKTSVGIKNHRVSIIKHWKAKSNMYPNYNKSTIPILEQKAKELNITDLQHAENGGEYHIKELGFWVDGYSKEKNIVIEYYEKSHKYQINRDLQRQKEIVEFLNCEFIIIKE